MANEMRLIDANALMDAFRRHMVEKYDRNKCSLEENCETCEPGCLWRKKVYEAPTVDAVEVVRCKDCKHFVQNEPYDPCECMKWTVKWGVAYVNPDDFCSYGERRTDV